MYDLSNNAFCKYMAKYRKSRGFTLESLGNIIGKTKATVSKYERGEIIPDITTILEICNALNLNLSQLFPSKNSTSKTSCLNPFNVNKLYLYYYTGNVLITSIIELKEEDHTIFATLYNGVKDITRYADKSAYYYEGILEFDKTVGYINLYNAESQKTQLEKLQISFTIPWSKNIEITNFFILGITPNSLPIVKKGILSTIPIKNIELYNDELLLKKEDLQNIQYNNAWILENKNYSNFFFKSPKNNDL